MKKAPYKNNAPRGVRDCFEQEVGWEMYIVQRFITRVEPLYDSLNPSFCNVFAAVMVRDRLSKVPAVVVHKKSRCRLISVLLLLYLRYKPRRH